MPNACSRYFADRYFGWSARSAFPPPHNFFPPSSYAATWRRDGFSSPSTRSHRFCDVNPAWDRRSSQRYSSRSTSTNRPTTRTRGPETAASSSSFYAAFCVPRARQSPRDDDSERTRRERDGTRTEESFEDRVRRRVLEWLREAERELEQTGRTVRLTPTPPSPNGRDDDDGEEGIAPPSLSDLERIITTTVNGLKAECRVDEKLYSICGDLVHARIALREAPFEAWLESAKLNLRRDVAEAVRAERELVELTIAGFYEKQFAFLRRLGLQSALKYDDVYLAELEDGKKESLGQFFGRLAAAAATESAAVPQFVATLVSGTGKPPGWRSAFEAYFAALSTHSFVPATPCMLSTGRAGHATASCYLLDPRCGSIDSAVAAVVEEVVPLLRARGGIGVSLQRVNGKHGVMPIVKLLDSLVAATNVDCVRTTGVCVYLEPWHADIMSALSMRGMLAPEESRRCDNVYLGLWTCDLLFRRFERYAAGERSVKWTLFNDAVGGHLASLYGEEFDREYERLEAAGLGSASVPVRDFMYAVIKSAVSTGSPFITFKDAFNRHFHRDVRGDALACSNLCTEIVHKTGPGENGVCNLASVNVASFVGTTAAGEPIFDYDALRRAVRVATVFVNSACVSGAKVTDATARGVSKHRSIGVGLQGLYTAIMELRLTLDDPEARALNRRISELMLLETMSVSCEFCERGLDPFPEFETSAYAKGWLHYDGWDDVVLTEPHEWDRLRRRVEEAGLYNSQFVALMPTAASAQVTEVSEGFSPIFSNLFSKITSTGELPKPNEQLMRELRAVYAGDESARREAVAALDAAGWSVEAALGDRPECAPLKRYKTAFEYDQKLLIDLCRDRAPFVDQSQSMTLFITETADGTLRASRVMDLLVHAFKCGLKTGMYYCKINKATNNGVFAGNGDLVCSACVI